MSRGGRRVLGPVSFDCAPGAALLVTGANGAGKTTLLRTLAGLIAPSAGTVDNPLRTGLAAHELALRPDHALAAELSFWARLDGAGGAAVVAALAAFGLGALADVPVRVLSAGQRRRAGLARLHASGASLWLLDEPTVGLDAAAVAALERALAMHRAAGGCAVVTTHQPLDLPGAQTLRLS